MDALIFVLPDFCNTNNFILHAQHSGPHVDPVTFYWSTNETTENISIPAAVGTYSVTVTDNVGCTATDDVTITDLSQFFYNIEGYNLCEGQQGQLIINWGFFEPPSGVTFQWSTGETTPIANISGSGTYTVTLTDPSSGCSVVVSENITVIPLPVPEISGTIALCSGNSGTLTVSGGPFSSITWDPNGWTTETVTINQPGIYTVTVFNSDGCFAMDTYEVLSSGDLPVVSGPPTLCSGQMATLTITNSSLFNSINWSDGSTTPSINIFGPGQYSVTVTDMSGCDAVEYIDVLDTSFSITGTETSNTSCGSPNGIIDITVAPTGSYTYAWSNGATTEDLTNISGGSYEVTVTDQNMCTNTLVFGILDTGPSILLDQTFTNATCGQANGSINLTVSPVGTYTFSWSNGAATEDISNLVAGTYNVTVTGSSGCTNTTSVTIGNDNSSFSITGIPTENTSCLTPNGGINLTVTPNGSYTFSWSNGAATEDINNLAAGTYSVTVTDAASCISTASFSIGENNTLPILTTTSTNAACGQANGSVNLMFSPVGTYTFSWSNGAATEDISNLLAGTYTVTVTGSNGCTATNSTTILNDNSSFSITGILTENTSCLTPNGSINLTVTPSGSYTFSWSNGAPTEDINNLIAGTYGVTVTDAASCSSTASYSIVENVTLPMLSTTSTNATCGQANGSVNLMVSPLGTYTFSWSNSAATEDISNLLAGTYNVTVTGSSGCTNTTSVTIGNNNSSFNITGIPIDNTSCLTPNGKSNGATTEDINNLTAGTYSVTVTDAASCSSTASFSIGENITLPMLSTTFTNATCGQANGSINLTVSPAGSYTFSWSNGAATEDISNLLAGTYNVTVTGSNGCTATNSTTILNDNLSFSITGIPTENTSCLAPNGSINLMVTPSGSYTFSWSNGATTEDINNLTAGTYSVTVTDAASCSSTVSFSIGENITLPMLSTTSTNATCGQANGSVNLMVSPVGTYTFSWSNGAATEDISNLLAGTYNVTVTGSNGCTATNSTTILNDNLSFSITGIPTENTSCLTPNGNINLTVTPSGSYTFSWSNGATTEDINNLTAGTYSVTVTDAASCSSTASFSIGENVTLPMLTTTFTNASCGQANGNINLTVSPAGTYSFSWSNGAATEDISNLLAGTYNVTVTGSNGCIATNSTTILNDNSSFSITGIPTENTSCLTSNGSINLTVTPSGSYTFSWSNGATTEDINNLTAGTYSVTVTDASSCSGTASFSIGENVTLPMLTTTSTNATCGQANGSINLTVSPAGTYTFSWSNGAATEDISNLSAGSYNVTVTGSNGCTATNSTTIMNDNSSFSITGIPTENTSCLTPNGSINLTVTPSGSYAFSWSNGATTEDINNLIAGTYGVTVTDAALCSSTASFIILENTGVPLIELLAHAPDCFGNAGWIEVLLPTAPTDLTYSMDRGLTFSALNQIDNLSPGDYEVMIKNALGCVTIQTVNIPLQQKITVQLIPEINLKIGVSQQIDVDIADLPIALIDTIIWIPSNGLIFADTSIKSMLHPTLLDAPDGTYSVTIYTHDGCSEDATIFVRNIRELDIYAPNIIHPEGNAGNSTFFLVSKPGSVKMINALRIYDRWGNMVFMAKNILPDDPSVGWSGDFQGQAVNPAVFVWLADITFIDDSTLIKKGDLTVIR
ncbi:MAG: gliding motility-associated C-terminal domain-containing protein [Saprospiraceae bacterium]|nr:gliding motility-associated C-terminal domain-containing protein [Saprospiraceae bacterium]